MPFLGLHPSALSRLAGVVGFTYVFQSAFAAVAIPLQTEKFYDFAGGLGYISSTLVSLYYPTLRSYIGNGPRLPFPPLSSHAPRQLIVSAMVLIWSIRLSSMLAQRIAKAGSDSRFDEIKTKPLSFAGAWTGQATWITLAGFPAWVINSIPRNAHPALGLRDAIAVGIWLAAFGLEITADREKSAWREAKNEKKHDEAFIKSGVWSWSRHPNYVGETLLWLGPSILSLSSLPPLSSSYLRILTFISPVFTYVLLRYGSGVPLLEKSGDKKWGSDPAWQKYKKETSMMMPWPGGLGKGSL